MMYILKFILSQTFSIMDKSLFKVKKTCGSAWLLWLSHKNLFASEALIVIGDVHLSLFALTSLQTLLEMKIIVFFTKDLVYKAKSFFEI